MIFSTLSNLRQLPVPTEQTFLNETKNQIITSLIAYYLNSFLHAATRCSNGSDSRRLSLVSGGPLRDAYTSMCHYIIIYVYEITPTIIFNIIP